MITIFKYLSIIPNVIFDRARTNVSQLTTITAGYRTGGDPCGLPLSSRFRLDCSGRDTSIEQTHPEVSMS